MPPKVYQNLGEQFIHDPSAGSPYGNHVTTFPSSPHYNIKASTENKMSSTVNQTY